MTTVDRLLSLVNTAPMQGAEFNKLRLEIGEIIGQRDDNGNLGRYGGCTQGDLARVLNRTVSNVNKYENDMQRIPGELATLLRLIRRIVGPT